GNTTSSARASTGRPYRPPPTSLGQGDLDPLGSFDLDREWVLRQVRGIRHDATLPRGVVELDLEHRVGGAVHLELERGNRIRSERDAQAVSDASERLQGDPSRLLPDRRGSPTNGRARPRDRERTARLQD